jgi:hypothetical protein
MDMQADDIMQSAHETQVTFYLTGQAAGEGLDAVEGLGLRPALFAAHRDLAELRYDFPLVLLPDATSADAVRSLTELFNAALAECGEKDADRLRHHAQCMERELRRIGGGSFGAAWKCAAEQLGGDATADSLQRLRAALPLSGEIVDCDANLPSRLVTHAYAAVSRRNGEKFRADLSRLILKLNEILRADFVHSAAGHSPENLRAAIGQPHAQAFDFAAMSRLLASVSPASTLSDTRRERIRHLLSVLQSQRFYAPPQEASALPQALPSYSFVFDSCSRAVEAWHERLPRLVELAKAIAIAQLEVKNEYREDRHDALFASFAASTMSAAELACFPDYLVRLDAAALTPDECARVHEALAAGLPMKILMQTDDLLAPLEDNSVRPSLGLAVRSLANAAIAVGDVFVLQSSASNLLRLREQLFAGLSATGPALFSVFSGAQSADTPPYLVAAAAMESRAFPAFVYDPSAGADLASRFSVAGNPQPERDWPVYPLAYEDVEHERAREDVAFTAADFLACDPRYAAHFARVPRAAWNGEMVPATQAIVTDAGPEIVPYLLMVDEANRLQKVMAADCMIREARRIAVMWRSLRELGGIGNSHAERAAARERAAWEEQRRQREVVVLPEVAEAAAPASAPVLAPDAAAEPERNPNEPYIETARCSSCNECTQINDKMFAYNKDKQAYIKDLSAGTYRQMVEAAESCQVSVIHPGKPWNPNEPGLEELLQRAAAFA